ncbi:MAG: type II toxin-antitoxin system HipA family toxin [Pseudomonadota bacterium]|nr:type II toxin-antitoxin system HipA family toxin [Pseudomonadota bacterium]
MARRAHDAADAVDVYLDAFEIGPLKKVGRLFHRRSRSQSALSFAYSPEWLASRDAFPLDPRLELYAGEQFAAEGAPTFGVFLDSAPDRWGRVLLDRREAIAARDERRAVRTLVDWDYLLGVHDECRLGALRFRRDDTSPFLDQQSPAAPPITSLRELEAVSLALQAEGAEKLPAYRQWIATLLAPGTSLGGSRPKANFRDRDDSLWIAKFPSADDRHDMGAWEHVVHELAIAGRIEVPTYRLVRFNHRYRTFCSRRFDRTPRGRRFFVSAMTLLERRDGEGGSYLEIAEFIQNHGARGAVEADLAQLLRRVLFNVLVGNTDDHLRNHGFLREATGWRLAPAFDLNPNPARRHHALRLDEASDEPDLEAILRTAEFYRVNGRDAQRMLDEVRAATRGWKKRAKAARLSASEIASIEPAFALSEEGE